VAHSLVLADETGGVMRYRMLETLREYAAARLREADGREALRDRHRDYYLALAEHAEAALSGPEQAAWLDRLTAEHDNLRAALSWCEEDGGGADAGLRLAGALWRFWELRGHLSEGRQRLERALATRGEAPPTVWARALGAAGNLARTQNDLAAAGSLYTRSLDHARAAGEPSAIAAALTRLGILRMTEEQFAEAQALFEEGLAIRTALNDQRGIGNSLHNLAYLSFCQGEIEQSRKLYEACLDVRRQLGDRASIALTLNNLAFLVLEQGDAARSRALFEEGLTYWRGLQDQRGMVFTLRGLGGAVCREGRYTEAGALFAESLHLARRLGMRKHTAEALEGLASVALGMGQPDRAARILGASDALRETVHGALSPDERLIRDRIVAAVRRELTDATFAEAWADGKAMTVDEAIAFAVHPATVRPPSR
jgi:tetratricopeptide (TPR) repeat protein